jgi:hypothetical protein
MSRGVRLEKHGRKREESLGKERKISLPERGENASPET